MPNQDATAENPRELTKAEAFYVSAHYGLLSATVLATDLDAPIDSAQAYLDKLKADGVKPVKEPMTPTEAAGFHVQREIISLVG